MKPENRPDNILISPKYYEAWNRPDSGISQIQAMKPRNRPNNILMSPVTTKLGIVQIVVYLKYKL